MFESVLIANRGEIACRIMRTCRRLGIRTIAVFSEADRGALFVELADEAYAIGPADAAGSYLNIPRILEVAAREKAQAIHPGYGFLSENAGFARACAAAGVRFVGPSPEAIEKMGMKDRAKALMEAAGVPVVPGYHGHSQEDAVLRAAAESIGFPVLIKASAGGGGKGMRRVDDVASFDAALSGARREAQASFGDDRVLVEKYIQSPRHIEVQVFGDAHGQAVHLFERDCSVQRRHQKVIEEAPAPHLGEALRQRLGAAAVRAVQAVSYEGAGTIEFILDASEPLGDAPFYFMEMNTRLQVEHPVTELITGVDLVEWQLRVAAGEPLPLGQEQLRFRGHAIEVRLYAEDPTREDLPQTGRLVHLRFPPESSHLRLESGVREGDLVTPYYDPMLAKLVVWDHDRRAACRRLTRALEHCEIFGLTTNLSLLARIARCDAFLRGGVDTGFLGAQRGALLSEDKSETLALWTLACAGIVAQRQERARAAHASVWDDTRAFRLHGPHEDRLLLRAGARLHEVPIRFEPGALTLGFEQGPVVVSQATLCEGSLSLLADGRRLTGQLVFGEGRLGVIRRGATLELEPVSWGGMVDDAVAGLGVVKAPLPGRVISLPVREGARVSKGDVLVCIEAMKMEHTLRAPVDGIVDEVRVTALSQVDEGGTLLVLRAPEES